MMSFLVDVVRHGCRLPRSRRAPLRLRRVVRLRPRVWLRLQRGRRHPAHASARRRRSGPHGPAAAPELRTEVLHARAEAPGASGRAWNLSRASWAASLSPSSYPSMGSSRSTASTSEKEQGSMTPAYGPRSATTRARCRMGGACPPRELVVERRGSVRVDGRSMLALSSSSDRASVQVMHCPSSCGEKPAATLDLAVRRQRAEGRRPSMPSSRGPNQAHTVRRRAVTRWAEKRASGLAKSGPRKTNPPFVFYEPG